MGCHRDVSKNANVKSTSNDGPSVVGQCYEINANVNNWHEGVARVQDAGRGNFEVAEERDRSTAR